MALPWKHPKTGVYWFRRRVPADLRDKIRAAIVQKTLRTKNADEAKSRYIDVAKEVDDEWRKLRRRPSRPQAAPPARLTRKQIRGILGEFHRWLVAKQENDTNRLQEWRKRSSFLNTVVGPKARRIGGAGAYFSREIKEFLAEKEIVVEDDWDRYVLTTSAGRAGLMAMQSLIARATAGDYSDPPELAKYPQWSLVEPTLNIASRSLSVEKDWATFSTECSLKPSTIKAWRPVLEKLAVFLGRDNVADASRKQAIAWKDALLARGLKQKTVAETYLAAARSFFNWGLANDKTRSNPFSDIRLRIPKPTKLRPKSLKDEEAVLILSETLRPVNRRTSDEFRAAKRWIPWLLAYLGARVNEITQMRGCDLTPRWVTIEIDGVKRTVEIWVLQITPEAGGVKTDEAREVPLHPHLVEQGFPEFVKTRGDGPIFYDPKRRRNGSDVRPQYQKVADKLADWVREIGVDDKGVSPNHGWRHRFNREARKVRMDPEVRDAIKGHKPRTEGELYGDDVPLEAKWIEIQRLPRIEVEPPAGERPGSERRRARSEARMRTARRAKAREKAQRTRAEARAAKPGA